MNTPNPTHATPYQRDFGAQPPVQGHLRMPARTAPERELPIDPGAVEYASWLRLLRRPAP